MKAESHVEAETDPGDVLGDVLRGLGVLWWIGRLCWEIGQGEEFEEALRKLRDLGFVHKENTTIQFGWPLRSLKYHD